VGGRVRYHHCPFFGQLVARAVQFQDWLPFGVMHHIEYWLLRLAREVLRKAPLDQLCRKRAELHRVASNALTGRKLLTRQSKKRSPFGIPFVAPSLSRPLTQEFDQGGIVFQITGDVRLERRGTSGSVAIRCGEITERRSARQLI